MSQYRTLREIDGHQYIMVIEHEEILKDLLNFRKALQDTQAAVQDLGKATSGLVSTMKRN